MNQSSNLAGYYSVDQAYQAVQALLAGTAFTADQKAAVSITNVVHATPGDNSSPVTSYTVSLTGTYAGVAMRLGDLQRSAIRILTVAMQTTPFQQLAALQNVSGIEVAPYEKQFTNLEQFLTVNKSTVKGPNS